MSISSEITRISQNVSDSLTAVASKGATVPSGANSDDLPDLIASLPSTHSVTYNLTGGASASVTPAKAIAGQGFSLKLSAPTGYVLSGVTVTMGGTDITSQVFTPDEAGGGGGGGSVVVTEEANATGITCVITTSGGDGPTPSGDIPLNTELVDYTAVSAGYYIADNTGAITAGESWEGITDYIQIDPSMTFSFVCSAWYNLAFYDSSKTLIRVLASNDIAGSTVSNDYTTGTLTSSVIPSNATYIVMPCNPYAMTANTLSLIRTA